MKKYIQPEVKIFMVRPMKMVATSNLRFGNAQGTTGNVRSGCNDAKEDEDFEW